MYVFMRKEVIQWMLCCGFLIAYAHIIQYWYWSTKHNTTSASTSITIPRFTSNTDKNINRVEDGAILRKNIAICIASRSLNKWKNVNDTSLQTLLIPSLVHTITQKELLNWNVQLYIAFNDDDLFWRSNSMFLYGPSWLTFHNHFFTMKKNKIPFNEITALAYKDGAEYIVRVNDDTEFLTKEWITIGVNALKSFVPSNVGVVGPICVKCNNNILIHDMTHRTHLDIFETYYPAVFSAWWLDDWITKVYVPNWVKALPTWKVKHHTSMHGTRYKVQYHEKNLLDQELAKGKQQLNRYLDLFHSEKYGDKIQNDWMVLLTVNNGFFDFFQNWLHFYKKLKMPNDVIVIAEDDVVYEKLKVFTEIQVQRSLLTFNNSYSYNSLNYKKMVSTRATHILRYLSEGKNVLYSDVDTVWLSDPTTHINRYTQDIIAQVDGKSNGKNDYYCTGFMAIKSNIETITFFKKWEIELKQNPQLNQPIFNRLLYQSNNITHIGLSTEYFPNGKQYFDQMKRRDQVVVVHNNYIIGHDKKKKRFQDTNLWMNDYQQTKMYNFEILDLNKVRSNFKRNSRSQKGEDMYAFDNFFAGQSKKIFLEMGALDGLRYSNTFALEKILNWGGILIEADPDNFAKLKKNRPKASTLNAAICKDEKEVHWVNSGDGAVRGIHEFMSDKFRNKWHKNNLKTIKLSCKTMDTVLSEHSITHIDFWSLDVEGSELEVLKSVDFSKVQFDVLCIESNADFPQKNEDVRQFLRDTGLFDYHGRVQINDWWIRKGFQPSNLSSFEQVKTHVKNKFNSKSLEKSLRKSRPFQGPHAPVQQSDAQLQKLWEEINDQGLTKSLLVFGLGEDSNYIANVLNANGLTVFLEDNAIWVKKILSMYPNLKTYVVKYHTRFGRVDTQKYQNKSTWGSLMMNLPTKVLEQKWDVVLVDAPLGLTGGPGRYQSIYMASKLVASGGLVIVDDCDREVEEEFSKLMLKNISNLEYRIKRRSNEHGSTGSKNEQCGFRVIKLSV